MAWTKAPVVLQKETPIGPDDTLGTSISIACFRWASQAMLEAADLVLAGKHTETRAGRIAGELRRLVPRRRGEDQLGQPRRPRLQPDPRLQSRAGRVDHVQRQEAADLRLARSTGAHVRRGEGQDRRGHRGRPTASMRITAQGGQVEIAKVKPEEGKKISAAEWAKAAGVAAGTLLGT